MVRIISAAALVALALATPAAAQFSTTPDIYGMPQFGTTTTTPYGTYHEAPVLYGQPQYGSRGTFTPYHSTAPVFPSPYSRR